MSLLSLVARWRLTGPSEGVLGEGRARRVLSVIQNFKKSMSCHMGLSGDRQNGVNVGQNRRFLRKKGRFSVISRVLRGVLSDIH